MKKFTLIVMVLLGTAQAFATTHYNCQFKLKSGEKLTVSAFSDINHLEWQSSFSGKSVVNNIVIKDDGKELVFSQSGEEALRIEKVADGQKAKGLLFWDMADQTNGVLYGRCTSEKDIGP